MNDVINSFNCVHLIFAYEIFYIWKYLTDYLTGFNRDDLFKILKDEHEVNMYFKQKC